MDNQNAKKGGLVGIAGDLFRGEAKLTSEEDVKRATDSSAVNNNDVVIRPQNYENVQTQSMVESTREQANKELAQIKAYNDEIIRRQKMEENAAKAKRGVIRIILTIFIIIILIVLVWMVINAILTVHNPPAQTPPPETPPDTKLDTVDGYKCKTTNCYKVNTMPDERIVIRDTEYYVYNTSTNEAILTTIGNQEFHEVTSFKWGDDILLDLDPESDLNGIYSTSTNRMVTNFNYDAFIKDINDPSYKDMQWVEGQYIVARKDGTYRLIRISDGIEVIRGKKRVFVHDSFYVSFNNDGERRLYTLRGEQFFVVPVGAAVYISGNHLVYIPFPDKNSNHMLYNENGKIDSTSDEYKRLNKIYAKDFINTMNNDKNYYKLPDE